jgi:hypothetical protein
MNERRALIFSCLCLLSLNASAEGWCDIPAGTYDLRTHGAITDRVYLYGALPGEPEAIWMTIADDIVGKSNVALILAAEMSGKSISVYLNGSTATCATYLNWAPIGGIRHVRILP